MKITQNDTLVEKTKVHHSLIVASATGRSGFGPLPFLKKTLEAFARSGYYGSSEPMPTYDFIS